MAQRRIAGSIGGGSIDRGSIGRGSIGRGSIGGGSIEEVVASERSAERAAPIGSCRRSKHGAARGGSSVGVAGIVALGAALALFAGCDDRECEAARLELARTWETLRDTATSRKQIPEASNLTPSEEQERIRVWTSIEDRAELMRSSFGTPQVTWPSADKARADLAEAFKPLEGKDDPMTRGFALTLAEADQRMANFRKTCR